MHIFQCMGKIFCVEFQRGLWNSTQNILPIHWKMQLLYNVEILRALGFKSSYVVWKRPPLDSFPVLFLSHDAQQWLENRSWTYFMFHFETRENCSAKLSQQSDEWLSTDTSHVTSPSGCQLKRRHRKETRNIVPHNLHWYQQINFLTQGIFIHYTVDIISF